ncbi:YSIRK-type signal peptide-containing protein, partial [Lactobacillus johnsonii]|uniref:mucin-binding protein n=1 Tax=Lactobacillus johnsonii TaxID=33959 RepID=UPI001C68EE89
MFNKEQLQRFSIRKLTVGTASVLIGVLFLTSWNTNKVYADSRNVASGESIAQNNNPQEGNPAVNKDNVQIIDNNSTEVSNISDSKSSKVIKSDATKSDIVRDKTTIDDNSRTKVPELTAQANNKQALTTVTEDNGAKVSKTEKNSNSDIKNQSKNSEKTQETTLVKKVLGKEKLSSESLIDQKKLDGKVEITATDPSNTITATATDPSNYHTELNRLFGGDKYISQVLSDKYIYQVLSLDGNSHSKLILSVNRNDHNDKNIYAYVTDGKSVGKPITIGMDQHSIITIDGREYQLNNNGSSEVSINGKKEPTQNSSTVTSEPGSNPWLEPWYFDNLPIGQDYGLGNTSDGKCSAIGEIVPVFTKNSVIKYYYSDNEGNLTEIESSPNVTVNGFTGQEFKINDVGQYKKVIQGYYLTSAPTGNFKGTLSQFSDDKYYKKVYYDFDTDTDTVEYSVLYHQISPDGTMEVWLVDDKGNPLTETRKIAPNTSTEFRNYNCTVRNPYVTAVQHEVQFIYKKLGSIIPVDENGKQIGDAIQFGNNPDDPTKALPGKVPSISGYTPLDKAVGDPVFPNPNDLGENIYVTYSANAQTAKITYIDDTTKTNLDSKDTSGKFGQAITFATAPADEIANYEKQGYVLVSSTFDNNKYQADNSNNVFYVHLKHKIENVTRNDTVTRTIHYLYDNGNTAQPDKTQTVSFNETGTKDDVTGKTTWDNDDAQTVDSVITPSITGYTPDKSSIEKQTFKFGDKDVEVTVKYTANTQKATITYIDDTTKTNLDSKDTSGKFGQTITFETAPADEIASYEKQGYVLVSSTFDNNKYQADNSNNVFYVHLKHKIENVTRNDTVTRTIHYLYDNGNTAQPDKTQTVSFNETGTKDDVTGKTTWDNDDAQTVDSVITPSITGYTPDKSSIEKQTFKFGDKDVEVTVKYTANTQKATITYIDDTTKTNLDSKDTSGKFGQTITFETAPADEIASYEKQGYVLVSSTFDNNKYQADDSNNVFYVHFVHGTKKVSQEHSASFTVHYIYKDDKQAKPDHEQTLSFTENGIQDLTTQKITWTPADSQKFDDVTTPVITGYTPDQAKVAGQTANFDTQDREVTVTYLPDAQHMAITYIDDTTGKTLHTDNPNGVSDQDAKYTTSDTIKKYEDQHYKLVSDSTNGQDLIFDHDDNVDQTYYVHFVHGTHTINQTTSPKQTIHYVYADGLVRQGKAADDNVQQLSFKRDGYNDEVTGVDHWNDWTPANSQYQAVDSPVIQGYTPDKLVVEKSTVNPTDKDVEITVTYNADKQAAHVIYIDKTTNTTLASKDLSGNSDKDSGYNTQKQIGDYQNRHYVLMSDETNGKNVVFDHNDNDQTYHVYFVHGTQDVNHQDDVTETVDYKFENGETAQPTVTQTKHFSEGGVKDLVTGKIAWDEAKPQKFDDVTTPAISGYTPDKDKVAGSTVKFGDKDIEVTVTYHNNAQKASVTYIDDKTGKTLKVDNLNGVTNAKSGYTTKAAIDTYTGLGYTLVSDDTNGNEVVFDNDDANDQA